ncbi:hypothetical protein ACROYT_G014395 [Oculina patagonica]
MQGDLSDDEFFHIKPYWIIQPYTAVQNDPIVATEYIPAKPNDPHAEQNQEDDEDETEERSSWQDVEGRNIKEEPKEMVFLSKLLPLFQSFNLCFFPKSKVAVTQTGVKMQQLWGDAHLETPTTSSGLVPCWERVVELCDALCWCFDKSESKVDDEGEPILHVTHAKFKEREPTMRRKNKLSSPYHHPRAELKLLEEELKQKVPEPVHTMLAEKEDRGKAISKYKRGKEMKTVIVHPPVQLCKSVLCGGNPNTCDLKVPDLQHASVWGSQPYLNKIPAGNLLLSAAILYSANFKLPEKKSEDSVFPNVVLCHENDTNVAMGYLQTEQHTIFSGKADRVANRKEEWLPQSYKETQMKTDSYHLRNYLLCPEHSWPKLKTEVLVLCVDGRMNSPGFSAKYCLYSMMDHYLDLIVDVEVVDKRESGGTSSLMKKMGYESWTECVDLLQGLSEEQKCNRERALIDEGPYRPSPEYAYMRIVSAKRLSLSQEQRKRKICQFHSISTKGMLQTQPSYKETSSVATQDYPMSSVQDASGVDNNLAYPVRFFTSSPTGRKPSTPGRSDKRPRHTPQHVRCTGDFSSQAPVKVEVVERNLFYVMGVGSLTALKASKLRHAHSDDDQSETEENVTEDIGAARAAVLEEVCVPSVVGFWRNYQKKLLEKLKDQEMVLAGDGRHDSMGHSAKYRKCRESTQTAIKTPAAKKMAMFKKIEIEKTCKTHKVVALSCVMSHQISAHTTGTVSENRDSNQDTPCAQAPLAAPAVVPVTTANEAQQSDAWADSVLGGLENHPPCPHCLMGPCITVSEITRIQGSCGPDITNHSKHHKNYRRFWKSLKDRGIIEEIEPETGYGHQWATRADIKEEQEGIKDLVTKDVVILLHRAILAESTI